MRNDFPAVDVNTCLHFIHMLLGSQPVWDEERFRTLGSGWTVPGRDIGDPAASGLYAPGTTFQQITAGAYMWWLDNHAADGYGRGECPHWIRTRGGMVGCRLLKAHTGECR